MGADRRHWALGALGFVLLLACARWQLGDFGSFAAVQDLDFFDESQYLAAGAHGGPITSLKAQWAAPYCLWYRGLHRLTGDTIVTYHLNAYVLAFALPALWYLVCLAFRVRPWWALASALALLLSMANLETLRVGNFAACIVLGSLLVGRLIPSAAASWWLAVAGLSVAAFVRPEFSVAAGIVLAIGAWQLSRAQFSRPKLALWLAAAILPAIALSLAFGLPLGGGRSGAAFQQHLAGNIVDWHGLPFSTWIHYEEVIRRYYALPASALDFLRQEPLAFFHHVGSNLWRLIMQSIGAALAPPDSLMTASRGLALAPILVVAVTALAPRRADFEVAPASAVLGACGLLILVSCAVIYPRAHYLPLLLCGALLFIAPRDDTEPVPSWRPATVLLAIAALFSLLPRYVAVHADAPRPQEATARALRALPDVGPLRLFDDVGILQIYANRPAKRLGPRDFRPPFDHFLQAQDINVVVLSPQLGWDPLLRGDPIWQRFARDPQRYGFRCQDVPTTDRQVCVR
jgi:hypothetical protein